MAAEGATAVVNSHRSTADGRSVAREIQRSGGQALYVSADMGVEEEVRALADVIIQKYGAIDIIVHNAVSGCERPMDRVTWSEFELAMRVNTFGLISLANCFRNHRREGSKLLYVSSVGAGRALQGYGPVGASKAASESVIRSLALEWAPTTQANVVRPNMIPTVSLNAFSWAEGLNKIVDAETPLGVGSIDQLASVALWLCSSEADYVTGQTITVDGGWGATLYRRALDIVPARENVSAGIGGAS
jgi:enoyl-[acyl-carrier protein] reductase III